MPASMALNIMLELEYKGMTIVLGGGEIKTYKKNVESSLIEKHDTYKDAIECIIKHKGEADDDYPIEELAKILKCIDRKLLKYGYKVKGFIDRGKIFVEVEKEIDGKYEYFVSVMEGRIADRKVFELSECYYPSKGAEFSIGKTDEPTQINIFGYHKAFGGAVRSLSTKGNSTYNHRQPLNVYV